MNVGVIVQIPVGGLLYHRGRVDGIDQFCVWEGIRDPAQSSHYIVHRLTIVFAPVAGD